MVSSSSGSSGSGNSSGAKADTKHVVAVDGVTAEMKAVTMSAHTHMSVADSKEVTPRGSSSSKVRKIENKNGSRE